MSYEVSKPAVIISPRVHDCSLGHHRRLQALPLGVRGCCKEEAKSVTGASSNDSVDEDGIFRVCKSTYSADIRLHFRSLHGVTYRILENFKIDKVNAMTGDIDNATCLKIAVV